MGPYFNLLTFPQKAPRYRESDTAEAGERLLFNAAEYCNQPRKSTLQVSLDYSMSHLS